MPTPRSWTEELIVEYYMLKGFMVSFDVPVGSGKGGGRRDIDIIALDMTKKEAHIVDITNIWTTGSSKIVKDVIDRLNRAVSMVAGWYNQDYRYIKRAVLLGEPWRPKMQKIINDLRQNGVNACSLHDLILEIIKYIDEWRDKMIKKGLVKKSTTPMLLEILYMLKLLGYMKDTKMLT